MSDQATLGARPSSTTRPRSGTDASPHSGGSTVSPSSAGWHRPAPSTDQLRADTLVAALLFLDSVLVMALSRAAQMFPEPASPVVSVVALAAVTLPLALRRRHPSLALLLVAGAFVVAGEATVPETVVTNIALFLALYSVGAWEPDRRRAAVVRAVVVTVMFAWLLITFFRVALDPPDGEVVAIGPGTLTPLAAAMLVQLLVNVLYFAGAVWFGNHAWNAARDRALVDERARELQAERTLVEAQAVTIERMRLARELHDAVAHHVSLIGVQAAAGRTLLRTDPARAATALERVEDSAREAIDELHGLLGTLRSAPAEQHEPVGSLGVDRLPDLVAGAREAGLEVAYQVLGEPVPLRPLASLNLYRIAQEALTNVRKHAGTGARADVRLRYLADAVELEVADDGAGRHRRLGRRAEHGGLGIVGMRERVTADGGTLHTGPLREGGFLVRARVPRDRGAVAPAVPDEHHTSGAE
ncbi:sensor histidine kinase [Georgenia sp. H159]|uniref:sensor histidine kinase n=1 Tax=Georgenia sp. H159 TaxID=3076115 RepID=UPI002D769A54|nr:sensor histidine kinase [Georgenia sp. H159]